MMFGGPSKKDPAQSKLTLLKPSQYHGFSQPQGAEYEEHTENLRAIPISLKALQLWIAMTAPQMVNGPDPFGGRATS